MIMKIDKTAAKLNKFFALSEEEKINNKHQERLLKSIAKLEKNKIDLDDQIQHQAKYKDKDEDNSERYQELTKHHKAVLKLLSKAKKHYFNKQ